MSKLAVMQVAVRMLLTRCSRLAAVCAACTGRQPVPAGAVYVGTTAPQPATLTAADSAGACATPVAAGKTFMMLPAAVYVGTVKFVADKLQPYYNCARLCSSSTRVTVTLFVNGIKPSSG